MGRLSAIVLRVRKWVRLAITDAVQGFLVCAYAFAGITYELRKISCLLVPEKTGCSHTASICFSPFNCCATSFVFFRSLKLHCTKCTLLVSPYLFSSSIASAACSSFCDTRMIFAALCCRRCAEMPNPMPAVPPVTM